MVRCLMDDKGQKEMAKCLDTKGFNNGTCIVGVDGGKRGLTKMA